LEQKGRKLQLIQKGSGSSPKFSSRKELPRANGMLGLQIEAPQDVPERARADKLVRRVFPQGTLKGIVRGEKAWDLRVIVDSAEDTSIIRLFGPEVTLSLAETERGQQFLTTLCSLPYSGAEILDHGLIDGQLYYRRPFFPSTLHERLQSQERFSYRSALGISLEVIRILRLWHENGVLHGHLTPSNICFSSLGEIAVVDSCVRLGQLRAAKEIGIREDEDKITEKYFAPETQADGDFSAASDIFALGHLIQDLFRKVKRRPRNAETLDPELEWMNTDDLEALRELSTSMCDERVEARPPLEYVERLLESRSMRERVEQGESIKAEPPKSGTPRIEVPQAEPDIIQQNTPAVPPEIRPEEALTFFKERIALSEDSLRSDIEKTFAREPQIPIVSEPQSRELISKLEVPPLEDSAVESFPVLTSQPTEESNGLPKEVIKDVVENEELKVPNNSLKYAVVALSLLCAFLAYRLLFAADGYNGEFSELSDSELNAAWESSVPSEMSLVAAAAVQSPDSGNAAQQKTAERIILKSAFAEGRFSDLVNYPLIRQAFDPRWEKKLNQDDRRVTFTIALGKLLGEKHLPKERIELGSINPGVLLSILSSLGNVPGVSQIPATRLTLLPPPLNFAFQQLVEGNPSMLCGDPAILGLARLQGRELITVDDTLSYLKEDTERRLRALAILLAESRVKAQQLVELLLNHPNLRLDHELIRWGIKVKLNTWTDHPATDQLFILSGLKPPSPLGRLEYVQLLAHPAPKMRQIAIEGVINQIPLAHPGAVPILNKLKENPELLSGSQTLELAQFLEKPEKATRESVQHWCETRPTSSVMADLLSSTADQAASTTLDSNLSLCLQSADWKPTIDQLRRLSHHPDSLTRVFIYTKLLDLGNRDPGLALEIYTDALAREKREDLRKQLELNISSLRLR